MNNVGAYDDGAQDKEIQLKNMANDIEDFDDEQDKEIQLSYSDAVESLLVSNIPYLTYCLLIALFAWFAYCLI